MRLHLVQPARQRRRHDLDDVVGRRRPGRRGGSEIGRDTRLTLVHRKDDGGQVDQISFLVDLHDDPLGRHPIGQIIALDADP